MRGNMSAANWQKKDWKKILESISSGEDSDEGDSLNLQSVQRNAHRVAELVHSSIPGMDESQVRSLPMGMNKNFIRESLAASMFVPSLPATETPASDGSSAESKEEEAKREDEEEEPTRVETQTRDGPGGEDGVLL